MASKGPYEHREPSFSCRKSRNVKLTWIGWADGQGAASLETVTPVTVFLVSQKPYDK
jgi:hypothetical protein